MARPRKPAEELTGKRSNSNLLQRLNEDKIYQNVFNTTVSSLTKEEKAQIGKIGLKLFEPMKDILETRGFYNEVIDRSSLISVLSYINLKNELLTDMPLLPYEEKFNAIKNLNVLDRMIEKQLKLLQLTPEMRNKIKENSEEFLSFKGDFENFLEDIDNDY